MTSFDFFAETRVDVGTKFARRTRLEGKIPAVLYGGNQEPEMITLEHHKVSKSLESEAVYSHILNIVIGDRSEKAVLKAIQRHPARRIIMHMDFMRVVGSESIRMKVPLHFVNEATCIGVKKGGAISHHLVDVDVVCSPDSLPEFIAVDVSQLDIGETLHLSSLKLPEGVELAMAATDSDHDHSVVSIHAVIGG